MAASSYEESSSNTPSDTSSVAFWKEANTHPEEKYYQYDIYEYKQVNIVVSSTIKWEKLLSKITPLYNVLATAKHFDETSCGAHDINITALIPASNLQTLVAHKHVKKCETIKSHMMARVELLETSGGYNYSELIAKTIEESYPLAVLNPFQQYKYVKDDWHNGHPCGYVVYLPVNYLRNFAGFINKLDAIICMPECAEFEISFDIKRFGYDISGRIIEYASKRFKQLWYTLKDGTKWLVCYHVCLYIIAV